MIVLSLCDKTGNAVLPWAMAGYRCLTVDVQERVSPHPNVQAVVADVHKWLPPRDEYALVMAWPPCTDLAVSGARWFKDKGLEALAPAIDLVARCRDICEWADCPWMLENPVGTLSTYWRKPDHTFDPCDYGDPYTKKTCIWSGGGFVMPDKSRVEPVMGSAMHRLPPSPDRADKRSATPMGFARAVFHANSKAVAT